tara:strand:- start:12 stop:356 length:345 start_codon:yes stop_codon:yes gene_type:complete
MYYNKDHSKKQFVNNIIASLLFIFLMLPSAFQLVTIFEKHEHMVCSEQQVHVHKSVVECEICSFQFTPLHYNLVHHNELDVLLIPETTQERANSLLFHSFTRTNIQLRGPPALT